MLTPNQVLDHYFLENRCMLLEVAATLDRYDRAVEQGGDFDGDPRLEKLYQSLAILADRGAGGDRAEQLLRLFSDPVV
jgi:hypothetical protein